MVDGLPDEICLFRAKSTYASALVLPFRAVFFQPKTTVLQYAFRLHARFNHHRNGANILLRRRAARSPGGGFSIFAMSCFAMSTSIRKIVVGRSFFHLRRSTTTLLFLCCSIFRLLFLVNYDANDVSFLYGPRPTRRAGHRALIR